VTTATGDERARLLGWVSQIEEHSHHPVARPFAELPRPFTAGDEPQVVSLRTVPGSGVEAVIADPGGTRHTIQMGTTRWISTLSREAERIALLETLRATGHRVDIAVDGKLAAVAVIAERLRDSVPETLAEFHRLELPVEVLTGDTPERATTLDLPPTRAGLLPDDKRMRVEELKRDGGKPLMVGDGINDAAALASAHVGIAMSSGTDIAVGTSAVTLYHGDLQVLPWAVALSRGAVRAVRRNLCRAVCYNLIGMTLAACGVLHPVVAALLMVVSSLSLVISSVRVGVVTDHCDQQASSGLVSPARRAAIHFVALVSQAVVILLLLTPVREFLPTALLFGGFALAGVALSYLWYRWAVIPHALDMCFGMLTLGNLGMLLGWWADNGFAPLRCAACCTAGGPLSHSWMWVGMLAFANAAMLGLGRRSLPTGGVHVPAMFTGGNLGMLLGMAAGGWCAAQFQTESLSPTVATHFVAMTLGMLAGMLSGTRLAEKLFATARSAILADEVVGRQPESDHDHRVPDVVSR
ncbi:MAG TPA: HAD-IC family P-type ATPase, partial [Gemmataceae bacterium]|nr:HAD-IC family P-type ATPase [Gemmataceae bacterium]